MRYQIIQVGDTVTIEVFKGNNVVLTKEFPLEGFNIDEAREQLKRDVNVLEIKQYENDQHEAKKNELKGLLNKKFDL